MIKKCSYFIGAAGLLILITSAFRTLDHDTEIFKAIQIDEDLQYHVPTLNEMVEELEEHTYLSTPHTGKTFIGFKEALAQRESRGDYQSVNTYGYMGKYQFGRETLKIMGIKNTRAFLEDPELQEKAFVAYLQKNKWILRKEIAKYEGKVVGGVLITESGILAAAHLGGAGAVQKFLRTNGRESFNDGYGTNIKSYLKKFAGFNMEFIKPHKTPMI